MIRMKFYFWYIILMFCHETLSSRTEKSYLDEKLSLLPVQQEIKYNGGTGQYDIEFIDRKEMNKSWNIIDLIEIFDDHYGLGDLSSTFENFNEYKGRTISKFDVIQLDENNALMLVVLDKVIIKILKFEANLKHFRNIQTMKAANLSDASFFKNEGEINLLIANDQSDNFVPLILFIWKNGQFNEQQRFYEKGVTAVKTFTDGSIAIVLIFQRVNEMFLCNIYELENQKLTRKQVIRVDEPIFVMQYTVKNETYISMLSSQMRTIYKWTGYGLSKISTKQQVSSPKSAAIFHSHGIPLIIASTLNSLVVYEVNSESIDAVALSEYKEPYNEVLSVKYVQQNETNVINILGNRDGKGVIESYKLKYEPKQKGSPSVNSHPLHDCLTSLSQRVDTNPKSFPFKQLQSNVVDGDSMRTPAPAMRARQQEIKDIEINDKFDEINTTWSLLKTSLIDNYKTSETFIKGQVDITGTVNCSEYSSGDIIMKFINNQEWLPNQWLSNTKNETILGKKRADSCHISRLETIGEMSVFKDLILNDTKLKTYERIEVETLNAKGVYVMKINDIDMENALLTNRTLTLLGEKTAKHLSAGSLQVTNINEKDSESFIEIWSDRNHDPVEYASNVFVDDIFVESIDDVHWNTFKDSVFRYGITEAISGNIIIKSFEANQLDVLSLNGVNMTNFMTVSTNQTINSSIHFNNIYLLNATTNTINSIPPESIVTFSEGIIKGPVSMEDIKINGNLILNSSLNKFLINDITGSKETDLFQNYEERIRIEGNLILNNLITRDACHITIDENEVFERNLRDKYWMKNEKQTIPQHVEFHEGLMTPHLESKALNNMKIDNYLLTSTEIESIAETNFSFENVSFLGNVFLDNKKRHIPNFRQIDSESVKYDGTHVIKGKKIFQDFLKVKVLNAHKLNNLTQKEMVTSKEPINITGKKILENMIISSDLNSDELSTEIINNENITALMEQSFDINEPQRFDSLDFELLQAKNMKSERLNGRSIDEYLSEINMFEVDAIDSFIINGKLTIENAFNLSKINGKSSEAMLANKINYDVLNANVKFNRTMTIDNLSATIINEIDFRDLTERLLYKESNQNITGSFTFNKLISNNLTSPRINNFSLQYLIDVDSETPQTLLATNGIEFNSAILKSIHSNNTIPCDIVTSITNMKNPQTQAWIEVKVRGNVTILDEQNRLLDVFENVVLINQPNSIQAPVNFLKVSSENVFTTKPINNVEIDEILADSLLKDSDGEQLVSGSKVFDDLIVKTAKVVNNTEVLIADDIQIKKFFDGIIFAYAVNTTRIKGRKTFFNGLQVNKLQSRVISNVLPENIYTTQNPQRIPSAIFVNITVGDLSIDQINTFDFHFFLKERLLLSGKPFQESEAICLFNTIDVPANVVTLSINGIPLSDVIFDIDNVKVTSKKQFANAIDINGNVLIENLNSNVLSNIYKEALQKTFDNVIHSNVEIMKPSVVDGIIRTDSINGYNITQIKDILTADSNRRNIMKMHSFNKIIEINSSKNFEIVKKMPSEILYLEKSTFILDMSHTQSVRTRNSVLLNIEEDEEGMFCGLPKQCKCPIQYNIRISAQRIFPLKNKGSQRVFNYYDDSLSIHFITNGVSTSATCRKSIMGNENEMVWSVKGVSTKKIYKPQKFTGYISNVEYFSWKNVTYAIVGKYYDSREDSYELDCDVYKFDKETGHRTKIDQIRTHGAWSLKTFVTSKGVILIIGTLRNNNANIEKTLFLLFDENLLKFVLLREVLEYGCSSAVGVTYGEDNFIALAHERNPALIFKYDHEIDNYVYYQHLPAPSPSRRISLFYDGDYGGGEPYLCLVSERGGIYLYTFSYMNNWKPKFHGQINGLRNLTPFKLNGDLYFFAASRNISSVLSVVRYG